jgi:predicted MarR family transcription regulator
MPRKKSTEARPSAGLVEQVQTLVENGADPKAATLYQGASEADFHRWMAKGLADATRTGPSTLEARFVKAIQKAEAMGELRDTAVVAQATGDTWQAAAYRLKERQNRSVDRELEELRLIADGTVE